MYAPRALSNGSGLAGFGFLATRPQAAPRCRAIALVAAPVDLRSVGTESKFRGLRVSEAGNMDMSVPCTIDVSAPVRVHPWLPSTEDVHLAGSSGLGSQVRMLVRVSWCTFRARRLCHARFIASRRQLEGPCSPCDVTAAPRHCHCQQQRQQHTYCHNAHTNYLGVSRRGSVQRLPMPTRPIKAPPRKAAPLAASGALPRLAHRASRAA
jgi:hypothetical protein